MRAFRLAAVAAVALASLNRAGADAPAGEQVRVEAAQRPVAPASSIPGERAPAEAASILTLGDVDAQIDVRSGIRVYIEGVRGVYHSLFGPAPDPRAFTRLPSVGIGLGAALREEPFDGAGIWLAFSLRNATLEEHWALVADGSGFAPDPMVVVGQDGTQAWYGGDSLARLRRESGMADVVSYSLHVPAGATVSVYLRLEGGARFGPSLALRSSSSQLAREAAIAGLVGALIGAALMVCFGYLLTVSASYRAEGEAGVPPPWARAAGYLYAIFVAASALCGYRGGGLSALLTGIGLGRYAAYIAFALLAMAAEASVAWAGSRGTDRVGAMMARAAYAIAIIAPALSAAAPILSYAPLAGLTAHVIATATREAIGLSRSFRRYAEEIGHLSARLDSETRGGRDLMTATAAAFRGPLRGLIGILEDLESKAYAVQSFPKAAAEALALAKAESARLDALVSNILDYAGLGTPGLAMEDLDAGSLARQAAGLARVALAGRGLRLDVDVPMLELRGDARMIHRLIYTAIGRAARSPGVRSISLTGVSDEASVVLAVEDDGREPLPSALADDGSQDIDMVVMSRIARAAGGSATYERSGLFNEHVIRLPRDSGDRDEAGPSPGAAIGPMRRPDAALDWMDAELSDSRPSNAGKVLIVGNEPVNLIAMKRRLEAEAWEVSVTVSAARALEMVLGGEPCDIAIVDSAFPGMSGFEFCASVRRAKSIEALPVIVLVEAGRPDEIERAFAAGASDYIARPVSGTELAARVRTHVDLAMSVRRELAQAARMAELDKYRTLAMLSAGVAHEINTPNNAVLRNVPMLKEIWSALDVVVERLDHEEGGFSVGGFGSEDLKREIPDILNDLYMGAQDIKRIVEGLKDYARAPSGDEAFGPVDVNESIRYATRLLKHSIALATDRLELALDPSIPSVHADRLKLTQVMVNVIENAVQSLPDRTRGVKVETRSACGADGLPDSVVVEVVDEGAGMDEATLARVFDPFFTTKRDRGGTGLGLAVSKGIVNDFGGTIFLSSRSGEGARVTIRIPAAGTGRDADGS